MQTLGNGAMFMEGLGMMGQAALGSAQAMAQNVTNLITNDGQKGTQVRQQRMNRTGQGMTGTGMGGPNITGSYSCIASSSITSATTGSYSCIAAATAINITCNS